GWRRRERGMCSRAHAARCSPAAGMLSMPRSRRWAGILRAQRLSGPALWPTIWLGTDMNDAALIERIAARGDGVTADGRHVAGAAPGDRVRDDGILIPGPNRTDPVCRHFGKCGGCQLQHVAEPTLADFVRDRVVGALEGQEV